jgi:hypothetical protein
MSPTVAAQHGHLTGLLTKETKKKQKKTTDTLADWRLV